MPVIYVDVLILLNVYVNWFLLKAATRLTKTRCGGGKRFLAAFVGSLFSLIILLPEMPMFLMLAVKLPSAFLVTFLAFGRKNLLRQTLYFYGVNFIFAGIMLLLQAMGNGGNIVKNGVLYINFSILHLVFFTAAAYAAVCVWDFLRMKNAAHNGVFTIEIRHGDCVISCGAIADSGNLLTDFISGKPVIFIPSAYEKNLNISQIKMQKIPYLTIGDNGLIEVWAPDCVIIHNAAANFKKYTDVLVGFSKSCEKAIFNPIILN